MEESPPQIVRNMRSIGLDLQHHVDSGRLRFVAQRPSLWGLETHLAAMHREVERFAPDAVIVDPLSSLTGAGIVGDVHAMVLRLVDVLKFKQVTALFTNLTHGSEEPAKTDIAISSLMDTWLLLYNKETNGEHNRQLYLLKSRGMAHSNQVREFLLTCDGIKLRDVYIGPNGVLTGSARLAQEAKERADRIAREEDNDRRRREFERKRRRIAAQIEMLEADLECEEQEAALSSSEADTRARRHAEDRDAMATSRRARGPERPGGTPRQRPPSVAATQGTTGR